MMDWENDMAKRADEDYGGDQYDEHVERAWGLAHNVVWEYESE